MNEFRIAVKAFVLNPDGNLLLIKRRDNDPHSPGAWEVPGGRLEPGEDPVEGLKRETLEETGSRIEVKNPLKVKSFVRDDGQRITMISFLCQTSSPAVTLSPEHTEFAWLPPAQARQRITPAFQEDIDLILKHFKPV